MAQELRLEARIKPQHVVQHQHLSVGGVAAADADSGARHRRRHARRQRRGYLLEHDGEHPRLVQQLRVMEQFLRLALLFRAQAVAAELVDALRRQTEVPHDGYPRLHQMPDERQNLLAALQLHRVRPALFHQPYGIAHAVFFADLVTAERHIRHHEAVLRAAHHALGKKYHLVQGDWERVLVAAHHVARAVAHENHIEPRLVEQAREREIVTGQHGYLLACRLHLTYFGGRHPRILNMYGHI